MANFNFDPNLNLSGCMTTKTIKLIFGAWDYRSEITVETRGNAFGLDTIRQAVEDAFDTLSPGADGHYEPYLIMTRSNGEELECGDEEERCEEWLADMLISAAIIDMVAINDREHHP